MIADYVSYEMIAITMFATMLLMLLTGQRVFGAIGFVAAMAALLLWGDGAVQMPYTASWKLFKWYPMLTLPLFIYMGYMISESGIADDLYKMFHVYFGGIKGGLAIGTMGIPVSTPNNNPPFLNGPNDPSRVRVPSGKRSTDLGFSLRDSFACSKVSNALSRFLRSTKICPAFDITKPNIGIDLNSFLAIDTNQNGKHPKARSISRPEA